ncbi:ATP-binding cassette domain-containing protein [Yinghuangia sp. ASG 101]|uniref:ABC transporter ATP-binding protein n=1 Tax=Yinghuangia sp. ASG 101 TaxID=2896848 RepID=UPI001E3D42AA|nr:ATP-binding cassette domain-containing protein [Yinghuangia sp. ASG 101]UGQ12394.1 ATP-binding cassette domain-containing protein [Yinghuangia sp. ASG 101]
MPFAVIRGLVLGAPGRPPVLRGADLSVRAGEVVGITGASGAGKTMLALTLLGHVRPGLRVFGGRVDVAGTDPLTPSGARLVRGRVVTFLGQDPASALHPARRLGPQIAEAVRLRSDRRLTRDQTTAEVVRLLTAVGLPHDAEFRRRHPHRISGGQAQRVALAMTLAGAPRLLILDEPTSGLDAATAAHTRDMLADVLGRGQRAAVLISHDHELLAALADRVETVEDGKVTPHGAVVVGPTSPRADRAYDEPRGGEHDDGSVVTGLCADLRESPGPASAELRDRDGDDELPAIGRCADDRGSPGTAAAGPGGIEVADGLVVTGLCAHHRESPAAALTDITFVVPRGSCTAVVGVSGAGKTTLARCLAGLHPHSAGTVRWNGKPLARHDVQVVRQDPVDALNPRESALRAVRRPLERLRGLPRHQAGAEALALLASLGIPAALAERRPSALSGGQRQRVALARALAADPILLICDEPTSALDPDTAEAVMRALARARHRRGTAVLLITHNLPLAARHADRILTLADGRITRPGPVGEVVTASRRHPAPRASSRGPE